MVFTRFKWIGGLHFESRKGPLSTWTALMYIMKKNTEWYFCDWIIFSNPYKLNIESWLRSSIAFWRVPEMRRSEGTGDANWISCSPVLDMQWAWVTCGVSHISVWEMVEVSPLYWRCKHPSWNRCYIYVSRSCWDYVVNVAVTRIFSHLTFQHVSPRNLNMTD